MKRPISIEESGAFMEVFAVEPTGSGILDGLTFAVKDLIDIAGHISGCGNPTWRATHPPATAHAICVEQLLSAGARSIGKTITDELAYSLLGENHHYGTPLNPKVPDRVPGGSSSGSASAVACQIVDFALGTDTGGSVRVPAANCGIFGFRPTHARISVAGVNPLGPSLDTVGLFANNIDVLSRAAAVLLGISASHPDPPESIYLILDAFEICDVEVKSALQHPVQRFRDVFVNKVHEVSLHDVVNQTHGSQLQDWREIYRVILQGESGCCLGAWAEHSKPEFGPLIAQSFELIRSLDRKLIPEAIQQREILFQRLLEFLGPRDLLCIPTVPSPAPLKGTIQKREQSGTGYYPRTLALTSIAGVARLPQISLPIADLPGIPLGLSLVGRHREDAFLLGAAQELVNL